MSISGRRLTFRIQSPPCATRMLSALLALSILLLGSSHCDHQTSSGVSPSLVAVQKSDLCPEQHWVDASYAGLGCLLFTNDTRSWEESSNYCQDVEGARLVEVETSQQMDFLRSELSLIYDFDPSTTYWWTSGTDLGREGEWYWASSGAHVPELVWGNKSPSGTTKYNCMVLTHGQEYFADDQICTKDNLAHAICQKN